MCLHLRVPDTVESVRINSHNFIIFNNIQNIVRYFQWATYIYQCTLLPPNIVYGEELFCKLFRF